MDTCFPDDSALGQLLDEYWQATAKEDWDTTIAIAPQCEDLLREDLKACQDNKKVMAAVEAFDETLAAFFALDNWEDVMAQNIQENEHYVQGFLTQAYNAWEQGKYYDSGNLAGLTNTYVYKMPEQTLF